MIANIFFGNLLIDGFLIGLDYFYWSGLSELISRVSLGCAWLDWIKLIINNFERLKMQAPQVWTLAAWLTSPGKASGDGIAQNESAESDLAYAQHQFYGHKTRQYFNQL